MAVSFSKGKLSWSFWASTLGKDKRNLGSKDGAQREGFLLIVLISPGDDKATIPVADAEFSQAVNPQSFCTGVSLHHPALIQSTGPLIDMSDIRPGTSMHYPQGDSPLPTQGVLGIAWGRGDKIKKKKGVRDIMEE